MKIVHLITDLDMGGAQVMLFNLLKQPAMAGMTGSVISLIEAGMMGSRIRELGIPVESLGMHPGRPDVRALWKLIGRLRQDPPDLIQTWMYHADLLGGLAARLAGNVPVIWGLHHTLGGEQPVRPRTMAVLRLNAILSSWLPRRVVCCAESTRQEHERVGYSANRMVVIPNGIDLELFHPDPQARHFLHQELGLDDDIKLVGMFARFHPQKDHRTFIEAARLQHLSTTRVHYLLAGEGVSAANQIINEWVENAGLSDRFHLLGLRQDMPHLLAGMDITSLSSSHGEALSMSIAESMACGTPAVVTDVGDAGRLVGNTGRVVPIRDPAALSDAWMNLLSLTEIERSRLGQMARSRIRERYNIFSVVERYLSLYRSIIIQ